MSVWVAPCRGHDICKKCGSKFSKDSGFRCLKHGTRPDRMYLGFRGIDVETLTGKPRYELRYDSDGFPLSADKVLYLLKRVKEEKESGTFRLRDYVEKHKSLTRFVNYMETYIVHLEKRAARGDYSEPNIDILRSIVKNHLQFFNPYDIREINRGLIMKWKDDHDSSDKMKNKAMIHLQIMLNWAFDKEDLRDKPRRPPLIQIPNEAPIALTREQQELLMDHAAEQDKLILRFEMEALHRPSVIRALKVKDIGKDIYTTCRRYQGTGKKEKIKDGLKSRRASADYPLRPVIREIFNLALKDRVIGPETFIFVRKNRAGEVVPYSKDALRRAHNKARKAAGLPEEATNYAYTRHSGCSQLMDAGANADQAAMVMDNSPKMVRNHYRSITADSIANVFDIRTRQEVRKKKNNG